jgi:hypothetical protein
MEKGAADSMRIAAMLVYGVEISGESASRVSARIRRRRKHIMAVTTILTLTLSAIHHVARRIPFCKVALEALSTTVKNASTAKNKGER